MTVVVTYIARGVGGGLASSRAFFDAYHKFPPGFPHRLVVIGKGWDGVPGLVNLRDLVTSAGANLVMLPDDGFDWGAYMRIAPALQEEWLCILNTHSRPMVAGWLEMLVKAVTSSRDVGAVGATGSWGSMSVTIPKLEPDLADLALYLAKLGLVVWRLIRNIRRFPAFPCPHLRSNAILIKREIFISFCEKHAIPASKRDAHELESGRQGLTAYLCDMGFKPLVVGADGRAYAMEEWDVSGTFRVPGQLNLLIQDNQTRYYENADRKLRRRLEHAAWGRSFTS